jgi:hypothetical protein
MAVAVVKIAWLLVLAGCERFDLDRPIDVIPASSWSELERETLVASANCWRLEFGIDFEVRSHPIHDQAVYFDFDTLACWDSGGRYLPGDLPGDPAHDSICPLSDIQAAGYPNPASALFAIGTHELGHALNIGDVFDASTHDDEELVAVMGGNDAVALAWPCVTSRMYADCGPAFQAFDQQVLSAANPTFEPTPACANVELVPDATTTVACGCR